MKPNHNDTDRKNLGPLWRRVGYFTAPRFWDALCALADRGVKGLRLLLTASSTSTTSARVRRGANALTSWRRWFSTSASCRR